MNPLAQNGQMPPNPLPQNPATAPQPAPQSPAAPAQSDANAGQEFASPLERQQLMELLEATQAEMASLRTTQFSSANAKEAARLDALKELFQMMQSAGVDLTSVESVNSFLEKLKTLNPNMAEDFEAALDALLGEGDMAEPSEQPPVGQEPAVPPTNETLPEGIRGPVSPEAGTQ